MHFLPILIALLAARYGSDWFPFLAAPISFVLGTLGMAGTWAMFSIDRKN
jgi:hypothetical protein